MSKLARASSAFTKTKPDDVSNFDMSKLAQASSAFTKPNTKANDGSKFDMSKLAASAQSSSTICSKTCSKENCSCETTPFNTAFWDVKASASNVSTGSNSHSEPESDIHLDTDINGFDIAVAANDASHVAGDENRDDVVVAFEDAIIKEAATSDDLFVAADLGDVLASIDQHASNASVSAPTRDLAARLRVVATMNGPKALREKSTPKRSTLARPAPMIRAAAIRKSYNMTSVTWPAFTGRTASMAQPTRDLATVASQVIALREKANLAKPRTAAESTATRSALRAA